MYITQSHKPEFFSEGFIICTFSVLWPSIWVRKTHTKDPCNREKKEDASVLLFADWYNLHVLCWTGISAAVAVLSLHAAEFKCLSACFICLKRYFDENDGLQRQQMASCSQFIYRHKHHWTLVKYSDRFMVKVSLRQPTANRLHKLTHWKYVCTVSQHDLMSLRHADLSPCHKYKMLRRELVAERETGWRSV